MKGWPELGKEPNGGFIDHKDKDVIPFVVYLVWDFKDKKAKVKKNNQVEWSSKEASKFRIL